MAANVPSNGLSSVSPAASGPQTASAPRSIGPTAPAPGSADHLDQPVRANRRGSRSEPPSASRPTGPGLPVNMTQPGILPRDHRQSTEHTAETQSSSTLQVTRSELTRVRETSQEISPTLACMSGIGKAPPRSGERRATRTWRRLSLARNAIQIEQREACAHGGEWPVSDEYAVCASEGGRAHLASDWRTYDLGGRSTGGHDAEAAMYSGMAR